LALTATSPNKIMIAGDPTTVIRHHPAGVGTIVPGMLIEGFNNGGVYSWRPHSAAAGIAPAFIAIDEPILNQTLSTTGPAYGAGALIPVWPARLGDVAWMLIPSGQNVTVGDALQSNGDGKLKAATATTATGNVAHFRALETTGAVTADTRVRVQVE